jgi:hypothetical protein
MKVAGVKEAASSDRHHALLPSKGLFILDFFFPFFQNFVPPSTSLLDPILIISIISILPTTPPNNPLQLSGLKILDLYASCHGRMGNSRERHQKARQTAIVNCRISHYPCEKIQIHTDSASEERWAPHPGRQRRSR